ncbi:MAG: hypothetical protein K9M80_04910 [Candidatus Marinimicrobia bacterium]|nr:hypothetical protein [Candidatus Neomarinimicrobiota bacterium]
MESNNIKFVKVKNWYFIVFFALVYSAFSDLDTKNIEALFKKEKIELAAKNVIKKVTDKNTQRIVVVNSFEKKIFASYILRELEHSEFEYAQLTLDSFIIDSGTIKRIIRNEEDNTNFILLVAPNHAAALFDAIGRPDTGLKLPEDRFFCDWIAEVETTIRTYGIDYNENQKFQIALHKKLKGANSIYITTKAGTDLTLSPRDWRIIHGEIYTAPIENTASGTIIIDACAYYGPPVQPIKLVLKNGQIANLSELDSTIEQEKWMFKDLCTDKNAKIIAELGIGTNTGAKWKKTLMESE